MDLLTYLKTCSPISAEIAEEMDAAFKKEDLPKGSLIIQPGSNLKKVYFIEKGLTRAFYVKDDKDITHYFFVENTFAMAIESVFFNNPTPYGHEMLEKGTIRTINFPEIEKFIERSPELEKFIRTLLINALRGFSDKLYAVQFQTAKDRYQTLINKYPDILLRVPLGHIASYLGITQQTLSVIRAGK